MKLISFFTVIISISFSIGAQAQIYKWTDENGKVHYSQFKPQNKSKKTTTVKLNGVGQLPSVEIKIPIRYDKAIPGKNVILNTFKLNIAGANSRDVKIGNMYRGLRCTQDRRDIMWVDGNGYIEDVNSRKAITDAFTEYGYNITNESSSSLGDLFSRLLLNVELKKVFINRCQDRNYGDGSKNDVYIKVHWNLFDRLTKKNLFEGESEGVYHGLKQHPRRRGTSQAIERAFIIAARNILADTSFVKHFENSVIPEYESDYLSSLHLNIKYSSGGDTFKSKVSQLKQASLTIKTINGHGSGVLITADGYVFTNAHVIGDAKQVIVVVNDEEVEASVIRRDSMRDVAVLKIKTIIAATPAEIAKGTPGVGDNLYVIGTPLSESLKHTVTKGILSAERLIKGYKYYQTDATINPGNSGGPVFNESGALVAVSVAGLFSKDGAGLGVNYVIPIEAIIETLKIETGSKNTVFEVTNNHNSNKSLPATKSFKSGQETVPKTDKKVVLTTDKEKVFRLYEKALHEKQKCNYDRARSYLMEAMKNISENDLEKEASQIRDELFIHLPISIAKDAIEKKNPRAARNAVKPVKKYIKNHPKRFEYAKQLDGIASAIKYLKKTIEASTIVKLSTVRMFLREYYQVNGRLPSSLYELEKLLYSDMGPRIDGSYQLKSYTPVKSGYVIVFQDVSTDKEVAIKDSFDF